jgi:hypothetical protein
MPRRFTPGDLAPSPQVNLTTLPRTSAAGYCLALYGYSAGRHPTSTAPLIHRNGLWLRQPELLRRRPRCGARIFVRRVSRAREVATWAAVESCGPRPTARCGRRYPGNTMRSVIDCLQRVCRLESAAKMPTTSPFGRTSGSRSTRRLMGRQSVSAGIRGRWRIGQLRQPLLRSCGRAYRRLPRLPQGTRWLVQRDGDSAGHCTLTGVTTRHCSSGPQDGYRVACRRQSQAATFRGGVRSGSGQPRLSAVSGIQVCMPMLILIGSRP